MITCDFCKCAMDKHKSMSEFNKGREYKGNIMFNGKDICPECRKELSYRIKSVIDCFFREDKKHTEFAELNKEDTEHGVKYYPFHFLVTDDKDKVFINGWKLEESKDEILTIMKDSIEEYLNNKWKGSNFGINKEYREVRGKELVYKYDIIVCVDDKELSYKAEIIRL